MNNLQQSIKFSKLGPKSIYFSPERTHNICLWYQCRLALIYVTVTLPLSVPIFTTSYIPDKTNVVVYFASKSFENVSGNQYARLAIHL